ncbi:uncharacterized protein cubi_00904 [Cryptosporidium ubiquitum]|uniref:Ubiquitin-like domain-containing protein n=1 Tax=Cryptosporidium ubiquitum TaxID=857276 RepID=A0A1J4M9T2_9CRYT|nr:uncharacterized protein cubi_00904 [Cryptosporidium ubiquitum]OII70759.1 hypothetical protein cubi_00904 [Cryptosporidium ubiquitum]
MIEILFGRTVRAITSQRLVVTCINVGIIVNERNMEDNNEDDDLFGEDVAFSKESVEKRLGKVQRRTKLTKKVGMNKPIQQKESNEKVNKKDNNHMEEDSYDEEFILKVSKKKARTKDSDFTKEKSQRMEIGMNNEQVSEIITIEDEEKEKTVIKLNIKVYKRRESEIVVIKTLIVALYRTDSIKKLVTYISKNLNPKPKNHLEDIKVYFDGDYVNMEMQIKEIGIENEEQLEVKVPFECNWN